MPARPQPICLECLEPRRLLAGTVSGVVWNDLDGDGVKDAGEPGLANQAVFIDINADGSLDNGERSILTNANGGYTFDQVKIGVHHVRYSVPAGRRLTAPNTIDYSVNITGANVVTNRNFGSTTMGVLRGKVFNDANGDGIQQTGEQPLAGWRVFIDKNNDGVFNDGLERYRITNSRGEYRFANLAPARYIIRIQTQSGFQLISPRGGGFTITVASGQSFSNRNFAERQLIG